MDPDEPTTVQEVKEPEVKEEPAEETPGQRLAEALKKFDNAPAEASIDQWKKQFGDVFVSGFSETEIYVWRPVRRPEFVKIQTKMQDPNESMDQFQLEEMICETCVLWKSVSVPWNEGKAGTPQSLSEQIMQNSNFMSPQAASVLVAKL